MDTLLSSWTRVSWSSRIGRERQPETGVRSRVDVGVVEWHRRAKNGGDPVRPSGYWDPCRARPVLPCELKRNSLDALDDRNDTRLPFNRVRVALLQAIGAGAPRIHVERAVLLLGPRVVVLERQVVRSERRKSNLASAARALLVREIGPKSVASLGISGPRGRLERVPAAGSAAGTSA